MAKKKALKMPDYIPSDEEVKWYVAGVNNGIRIAPRPHGNEWHLEVFANKKWNRSKQTYNRENLWNEYYKMYEYYYNRR